MKTGAATSVASNIGKTQIDRLGDRLKKGNITEADLRLLDEYRRSFAEAYETVVGTIRKEVTLEPTGRPAKSTTSISEKLLRETIRLTQVQDIAGCRLIVADMVEQEQVVQRLSKLFDNVTIVDRTEQPSHGYRAVHVIVKSADKLVEIQVRTALQHIWAEQSEKLSDIVDPAIKYGGGDPNIQERLKESSDLIAEVESIELDLAGEQEHLSSLLSQGSLTEEQQEKLTATQNYQKRVSAIRQGISKELRDSIDSLPRR